MALQALGTYAERTYNTDLRVTISVENGPQHFTFTVTPENSIVQQSYKIRNFDKDVKVSAIGRGIVYGRVSWHYNVPQLSDAQPFTCITSVPKNTPYDALLNICCRYVQISCRDV